jgi:hypothetical protein
VSASDGALREYNGNKCLVVLIQCSILEMQVILTELLAKFSFSLPEDSVVRARFAGTQFPVDNEGVKSLWLFVERLLD